MNPMHSPRRIILAVLMAVAGVSAARGGTVVIRDVEFSSLPGIADHVRQGYLEQPVIVRNRSSAVKTVRMSVGNNLYGTKLELPPGAVRRSGVMIYGPIPGASRPDNGTLEVDGVGVDGDSIPGLFPGMVGWGAEPLVMVSHNVRGNSGKFYRSPPRSGGFAIGFQNAPAPVREWSGNHLSYSPLQGVMLDPRDWEEMPEAVRSALELYRRCGGVVLVTGADRDADEPLGMGVTLYRKKLPEKFTKSDWWPILQRMNSHPSARDSLELRSMEFRTNGDGLVPKLDFRILLAMMVFFALIVGPVSYFYLQRKKRLGSILWITPLCSLAMIGVILLYSFSLEGWFSRQSIVSYTVLDQVSRRAETVSLLGIYAPSPPDELVFSAETLVFGAVGRNARFGIHFDSVQRLVGDWVPPRTPSLIATLRPETRHEKIIVSKETENSVEIVNGLGAEMLEFTYRAPSGNFYAFNHPVAAGAKVRVPRTRTVIAAGKSPCDVQFALLGGASRDLDTSLGKGWYLARLTRSPFAERGLEALDTRWLDCRVAGYVGEGTEK